MLTNANAATSYWCTSDNDSMSQNKASPLVVHIAPRFAYRNKNQEHPALTLQEQWSNFSEFGCHYDPEELQSAVFRFSPSS
jgi:hypothetical protein